MRARFIKEDLSFKRGGDPLTSLGLGGHSFETLRPGAVLRSKKYFGVARSSGKFGGFTDSAINVVPDSYLLVTDLSDTKGDTKNIWLRNYYKDREDLEVQKERMRVGGNSAIAWWGTKIFIRDISKLQFNNRFEIIEPGFIINESIIDFKRGVDPHRALKIGDPFLHLQPGDILKATKDTFATDLGQIVSSGGDTRIWQDNYIVVLDIHREMGNRMRVYYYQCWDTEQAKKVQQDYKEYRLVYSFIATPKQLKNRFKFYEG